MYFLKNQPKAIPYITSYYKKRWGFCISYNQYKILDKRYSSNDEFKVVINSTLNKKGNLNYGEVILKGKSKEEILISTYICHPSMANNELSGPTVTTYLAKWIQSQPREYTYRIIFIPETIGSICYLSKNIKVMKKNTIAGFNISCVGDDNAYSYLASRDGETISDKIALHVLKHTYPDFIKYSYLDRGSDERQYCSPGVDLPIASVMRTKYGAYKEYHTSLDNLSYISPEGLFGAYKVLANCIECIENNKTYKTTVLCEPQMGRRNLRPTLGASTSIALDVKLMSDILVYADGKHDVLSMSNKLDVSMFKVLESVETLVKEKLLTECIS